MHYLSKHTPGNVGTPMSGFLYPFHVIPTPLLVGSRELRNKLLNEAEVQAVINKALQADFAMLGIGGLTPNSELNRYGYKSEEELEQLKNQGAVGQMHGEYFDADGKPLDLEHHSRLISVRLEQLQKMKHVVGVAGGKDKVDALRAALKGGFIHSLITDEVTAKDLLNMP